MKFTKEQAIESLKRELTNSGKKTLRMSERTLNSIVDALLPKFADDETGLPDFITEVLAVLNPVNDNIGKDRSDFVRQWEKDHPNPEPQPEPTPQPNSKQNPQQSEELIALKKEIEELKNARLKDEQDRKIAGKRTELVSALKAKGVKDNEWMESFLSEVNITEDFDVEAKADAYMKLYNKNAGNVNPTPTPDNPTGGSGSGKDDSVARLSEFMTKRAAWSSGASTIPTNAK
jgi:hypothetical protein